MALSLILGEFHMELFFYQSNVGKWGMTGRCIQRLCTEKIPEAIKIGSY